MLQDGSQTGNVLWSPDWPGCQHFKGIYLPGRLPCPPCILSSRFHGPMSLLRHLSLGDCVLQWLRGSSCDSSKAWDDNVGRTETPIVEEGSPGSQQLRRDVSICRSAGHLSACQTLKRFTYREAASPRRSLSILSMC